MQPRTTRAESVRRRNPDALAFRAGPRGAQAFVRRAKALSENAPPRVEMGGDRDAAGRKLA